MKKCSKCLEIKELEMFGKHNSYNDGHNSRCKSCIKQYNKQYCEKNRDTLLEDKKLYYTNNRDVILDKVKQHYNENKSYIKDYQKNYRIDNSDNRRKYINNRLKTDTTFKLWHLYRSNMRRAIKGEYNKFLTEVIGFEDIYDYENWHQDQLVSYYERTGIILTQHNSNPDLCINIDHIVPVSSGTTKEDLIKLFHKSNMRIISRTDNASKGASILT